MTREEAISYFEAWLKNYYEDEEVPPKLTPRVAKEALTALRPVSREQAEKAWKGCKHCDDEWGTCNPITHRFTLPPGGGIHFCPMCGRPLIDEAVDMVMRRLEEMKYGE